MFCSLRTAATVLVCVQILLSTCPVSCKSNSHEVPDVTVATVPAVGHEHHRAADAQGSSVPSLTGESQACCADCGAQITSIRPRISHAHEPGAIQDEVTWSVSDELRVTPASHDMTRGSPNISPPGLLNPPLRR
jgi:hypothetical protein